jgi:hypothetical protein
MLAPATIQTMYAVTGVLIGGILAKTISYFSRTQGKNSASIAATLGGIVITATQWLLIPLICPGECYYRGWFFWYVVFAIGVAAFWTVLRVGFQPWLCLQLTIFLAAPANPYTPFFSWESISTSFCAFVFGLLAGTAAGIGRYVLQRTR